jgi:hypothetical protein
MPEVTLLAQALQQEPPNCFRGFHATASILDVLIEGGLHILTEHDIDLMAAPGARATTRPFNLVYFFLLTVHADYV